VRLLNIRRWYKAIAIVVLVLVVWGQLAVVLIKIEPGNFLCSESDPIQIEWPNCAAKLFIINQSCFPDGPEGGSVFYKENELPLMEVVAYESNNYWFSKEHVTRTGLNIVIRGKESDFDLKLPAACE
jgi:hypothetical protein